jgi:hypothetical protein
VYVPEIVGVTPFEEATGLGSDARMNNRKAIPTLKNKLSEAGLFLFTLLFYITNKKNVHKLKLSG